ncbi:hypothetical protein AB0P17_36315 [Streptomyces sp. NPDC088124]|uniref:hypothetical protein n=1 Tax=Streptomyces sp. NPDC088124 TaxID=3154654 RepID=UPI0034121242
MTDGLCGPCQTECFARIKAERIVQREAREAAAREAAEAEAKKNLGLFRRR